MSAQHCELNVNDGFWYVRDLNSRNGVKVNGNRVTEKRIDPGDILSIAKHSYEVQVLAGRSGGRRSAAAGRARGRDFSQSLLERAGLKAGDRPGPKAVPQHRDRDRVDALRYHPRRAGQDSAEQSHQRRSRLDGEDSVDGEKEEVQG